MLTAAVVAVVALSPGAETESAPSPDKVRALVAEMLADVDRRRSLLQSSGAGHDGGFYIADATGAFRLNIGGLIQFRYTQNHIEDSDEDKDDGGFHVTRTRLWFSGQIYDSVGYYVRSQFSGTNPAQGFEDEPTSGIAELDRAYFEFRLRENLRLRAGQMVSELTREGEHSPDAQLGVASSPTDSVFSAGGIVGMQLRMLGENTRAFFEVGNGARAVRRSSDDPRNAEYSLMLRLDQRLAGEWSQFSEFTSFPGSPFAAKLSGGAHWENGAEVGNPVQSLSLLLGVVELSLEGDGWNAFTSFHYSRNDFQGDNLNDYGLVVQGGVFISEHTELFGRFDAVFNDADRAPGGNEDFRTITGGFNYYPFPGTTAVKISVDGVWFLDAESDSLVNPSDNLGIRASAEDDQFAFRAQMSVRF